jgi:hypothetical protein
MRTTAPRDKRIGLIVLALVVFTAPACVENIIKDIIDIPEPDVFVFPNVDAGPSFDGDAPPITVLSLLNVKPDHGPFTGGTRVTITGSGFGKGIEVRVGGKKVADDNIVLLSPVAMEIVTPAGEVGPANIEVNRGDSSAKLPPGAFTYDPVFLDPPSGPVSGGTLVTLEARGLELSAGMKLELAGKPMTDVEVISKSLLRARTPAHIQGPASLVLGSAKGDVTIDDAFTYYQSTNQLRGGLGGGPINGTVTVSVLNWLTRTPVVGAKVVLQKGRELELVATADNAGIAVFKAATLLGPVTVTAGAEEHETSTIALFDQRDATIFLYPIIPPNPGGLPPGQLVPYLEGNVLFGGTTGAGLAEWKIVPPPKKDQVKRVYVFATSPTIRRHGPPPPRSTATVDFEPGTGATGWSYNMYVSSGNMAIYAIAGLYNTRTGSFDPYAMGLTRGVVTAPGDRLQVDVVVNIPLTEKVDVELKNVPSGVDRHQVRLALRIGADGYILREDQQVNGEGVPASLPFGRLPRFTHPGLLDASLAVDVVLDRAGPSGLPLLRATETLIPATQKTIVIDDLVGAPKQVKPNPGALLTGNTLRWSRSGATPDLAITSIETPDETPVWRVIAPGNVTEVKLPDPTTLGLPAWPKSPMIWLQWLVRLDSGYSYNTFNYGDISSAYWSRWSFDQFSFIGPQ